MLASNIVKGVARVPDDVPHVRSTAIESALASGTSALSLRVHFNYEADLAGGSEHQFASEIKPVLHVLATHGLGVMAHDTDDDGVVVVDTSTLASQAATTTMSPSGSLEELEAMVHGDDSTIISEGAVDWAKRKYYQLRIALLEKKRDNLVKGDPERAKVLEQLDEFKTKLIALSKSSSDEQLNVDDERQPDVVLSAYLPSFDEIKVDLAIEKLLKKMQTKGTALSENTDLSAIYHIWRVGIFSQYRYEQTRDNLVMLEKKYRKETMLRFLGGDVLVIELAGLLLRKKSFRTWATDLARLQAHAVFLFNLAYDPTTADVSLPALEGVASSNLPVLVYTELVKAITTSDVATVRAIARKYDVPSAIGKQRMKEVTRLAKEHNVDDALNIRAYTVAWKQVHAAISPETLLSGGPFGKLPDATLGAELEALQPQLRAATQRRERAQKAYDPSLNNPDAKAELEAATKAEFALEQRKRALYKRLIEASGGKQDDVYAELTARVKRAQVVYDVEFIRYGDSIAPMRAAILALESAEKKLAKPMDQRLTPANQAKRREEAEAAFKAAEKRVNDQGEESNKRSLAFEQAWQALDDAEEELATYVADTFLTPLASTASIQSAGKNDVPPPSYVSAMQQDLQRRRQNFQILQEAIEFYQILVNQYKIAVNGIIIARNNEEDVVKELLQNPTNDEIRKRLGQAKQGYNAALNALVDANAVLVRQEKRVTTLLEQYKSTSLSSSTVVSAGAPETSVRELCVDVPFNPAAAQFTKTQDEATWALPGARGRRSFDVPDERGRWLVPADASVAFNAYAETATQHGQLCRTRAGEALFLVSELLAASTTKDNVRAEWQTTGDTPLAKGFIDVHRTELVQHHPDGTTLVVEPSHFFTIAAADDAPTAFHEYDADEHAKELADATNQALTSSVNASLDVFFPRSSAPLATSDPPSLRRMHCPYFNTSAGLLHGSTYSLRLPRAPPPAHYYERALAATLVRNDADAEHVLAAIAAQQARPDVTLPSSRYVSKLFAEMLTVYANAMVYLDDFTNEGGRTFLAQVDSSASPDASKRSHVQTVRLVRRTEANDGGASSAHPAVNVVEDYKDVRLGHGDDCEGVAKEIYTHYWDFRRAALDASASPLLVHMQALATSNTYVPALVLAAVTNKKLDTATHALSDEDAMAHTYTSFVRTGRFLERLVDADAKDARFSGLAERVKTSAYARGYTPQPWHAGLDDVLVAEGTARASAFVRPTSTYYPASEKERIVALASRRYEAQMALVAALPMNVVQLEIPNRRVSDDSGAVARDEADVSDFYKANSSAYISAFRDTGVLDFAFAQTSADAPSGLSHGTRFTRFSAPEWSERLRLVPYNRIDATTGALADAVLSQLEPIPQLRRDDAVAREREAKGAPASLRQIETLFDKTASATGESTRSLLATPDCMPDVPHSIVVSVRAEDVDDRVATAIVDAVRSARTHFSGARIHTHYLSAEPVRGDETSLPPVVLYDIELRLAPPA